jgi:hypothetical protein
VAPDGRLAAGYSSEMTPTFESGESSVSASESCRTKGANFALQLGMQLPGTAVCRCGSHVLPTFDCDTTTASVASRDGPWLVEADTSLEGALGTGGRGAPSPSGASGSPPGQE